MIICRDNLCAKAVTKRFSCLVSNSLLTWDVGVSQNIGLFKCPWNGALYYRKPVDFGSFTIETTRVQHAEVDSVYSRHLGDPAVQWCITASMIGVYQSLRWERMLFFFAWAINWSTSPVNIITFLSYANWCCATSEELYGIGLWCFMKHVLSLGCHDDFLGNHGYHERLWPEGWLLMMWNRVK